MSFFLLLHDKCLFCFALFSFKGKAKLSFKGKGTGDKRGILSFQVVI